MRLSSNSMLAALSSNHLSWCHSGTEPTERAGFPVVLCNRILVVLDSNLGREAQDLSFSVFPQSLQSNAVIEPRLSRHRSLPNPV
jgi:hypothetical protein